MDLKVLQKPGWWIDLNLREIDDLMVLHRLRLLDYNRMLAADSLGIPIRSLTNKITRMRQRGIDVPKGVPGSKKFIEDIPEKKPFFGLPFYCKKHFYDLRYSKCPMCS